MLGIRFSEEDEERLAIFARRLGRPKSVVARDWILERLEREAADDQFRQDIERIAVVQADKSGEWYDAVSNDILGALDHEDGGYDWGKSA